MQCCPTALPGAEALRRQETRTHLVNVKVEDILEVLGLTRDEEVEAPTAAEIGDDDGVDGQ